MSLSLSLSFEDAKVVAVGGSDLERAKAFAQKYGVAKAYGTYVEVVNDEEVDVVYVATLHPYHKEVSMKASEAGKAVLCEKPLAMNATDAHAMIASARQHKTYFQEAMWTRYFPLTISVRNMLKEGVIGDVISMDAKFGFLSSSGKERMTQKSAGASAILDVGIYVITYAFMVFGPDAPKEIFSVGNLSGSGPDSFDTHFVSTLKFANGGIAIVEGTFEAEPECKVVITGTKGRIIVPNFWCPTEFTLMLHPQGDTPASTQVFNGSTHPEYALPTIPGGHDFNFTNSQGLAHEARYLQSALDRHLLQSELESLDESLNIMSAIDTISKQIGFDNYHW